jgi:hypothetical protein
MIFFLLLLSPGFNAALDSVQCWKRRYHVWHWIWRASGYRFFLCFATWNTLASNHHELIPQ